MIDLAITPEEARTLNYVLRLINGPYESARYNVDMVLGQLEAALAGAEESLDYNNLSPKLASTGSITFTYNESNGEI